MKLLKLRSLSIVCFILTFALFTGCSSADISKSFDEDEVKVAAENIVELVNNKDLESIKSISTNQMKEALNEDSLTQIHEQLAKGGEFESIEDTSIASQKDKKTQEEYAVSIVKAKYGDKKFIYTISFNEKMELAGLYVK